MSQIASCPKCAANQLRWVTLRRRVPVDVLQCQACGTVAAEEDWMVPLTPLLPGRCVNCGEKRDFAQCVNCGLTREEDAQVHEELRQMVDPNASFLDAARGSLKGGRKLVSLKLTTWAAVTDDNGQGDTARALRVWLLSAIGEHQAALDDAKAWVENGAEPSSAAWASYGQQLQQGGFPGAAADAYGKTLLKEPHQTTIRARRAQLLHQLHREGQAMDELIRIFEAERQDDAAIAIAVQVTEALSAEFQAKYRDDEVSRMLEKAGPHVEGSAKLLAHRARIAANDGDAASAKKDLKKARKLDPSLPEYEAIERLLKPAQKSWWPW